MKFRPLFCILIIVLSTAWLGGCGAKSDIINIGTQTYSEPIIIGEMARILIEEHTGLQVEHTANIGASGAIHEAMLNKDLDISVRYTGTELAGPLAIEEPMRDSQEVYELVKREYKERWNQIWLEPFGFENTYALGTTRELAEELGIETISDLAPYAGDLSFGSDTTWLDRPTDGYPAFVDFYGYEFGALFPMEIVLVYEALNRGEVDVTIVYSTDGKLKAYDLLVLQDDLSFFPPYDCAFVLRGEILEQYPELEDILGQLSGMIDEETMITMNYQADEQGIDHADIAREFLQERGLI